MSSSSKCPPLLLSALVLVHIVVLVVNIRNPLYYNPAPRTFGERASTIIGDAGVAVVDVPEIAFFIRSERRYLYLKANPRFMFGNEPFAGEKLPQFLIGPAWEHHPYLSVHRERQANYRVALSGNGYYLYERSR